QEVEEEVEEPVRPRDEADRPRVGLGRVPRPEQPGLDPARREVPDARQHDDHRDDDERHDRVVEDRVRPEALAFALDVLLVALVLGAVALGERDAHQVESPSVAGSRMRPSRAPASGPRSRPAAVFDHGGDVTPRRTTRYRCRPISAMIAPGSTSMCRAERCGSVSGPISAPPWRNCARIGRTNGRVALMLMPTTVAQYAVLSHGRR